MTASDAEAPPARDARHDALAVFLGQWRAEGKAYDPKGKAVEWRSTHSGRWHTGEFFLVQDERATTGGQLRRLSRDRA